MPSWIRASNSSDAGDQGSGDQPVLRVFSDAARIVSEGTGRPQSGRAFVRPGSTGDEIHMVITLRPRSALLVAGITLVLAACSGSSATAPATLVAPTGAVAAPSAPARSAPGQAAGACSIVTNDAVGQAGGFPVAASSGTDSICVFQNADKSKSLTVKLDRSQAEMALMLQIEPASEHIANLGDDAFWTGTGLLFVRKGDHALELLDADLAGVGPAAATFRDAMVALARTALPNV